MTARRGEGKSAAQLVVAQYRLTNEIKRIRVMGSEAMFGCRLLAIKNTTCLTALVDEYRDEIGALGEFGGNDITFAEYYAEAVLEGRVCTSCQRCRELKAERVKLQRKLGGVRCAMNRLAIHLQE